MLDTHLQPFRKLQRSPISLFRSTTLPSSYILPTHHSLYGQRNVNAIKAKGDGFERLPWSIKSCQENNQFGLPQVDYVRKARAFFH